MPFCETCGGHYFANSKLWGPHKCPPRWWCIAKWMHDDDPDDPMREVRAADAEEAAEKYVAWYENEECEYDVVEGGELVVRVTDGSDVTWWKVTGEMVPTYYAETAVFDDDGEVI